MRLFGPPSRSGRETWGIARLNALAPDDARIELLACCGSAAWAQRMVEARPFADLVALKHEASRASDSLTERDWLEAFAAHPRIGEKADGTSAAQPRRGQNEIDARGWSSEEQSRVESAGVNTLEALAEANRVYEAKHGFIYIVCATGKGAEEMLALLQERAQNDRRTEVVRASEEQRKITDLRLEKLVVP
jgi:allantoicase